MGAGELTESNVFLSDDWVRECDVILWRACPKPGGAVGDPTGGICCWNPGGLSSGNPRPCVITPSPVMPGGGVGIELAECTGWKGLLPNGPLEKPGSEGR